MTTLATAYVAQRAADFDLDPAILATRADLVEFMQDPPQGRLAGGWRGDLVGEGLRRLAEGKASLSFDGHGALVLEERSFRSLRPGGASLGCSVGRGAGGAFGAASARRALGPQIDAKGQDAVL